MTPEELRTRAEGLCDHTPNDFGDICPRGLCCDALEAADEWEEDIELLKGIVRDTKSPFQDTELGSLLEDAQKWREMEKEIHWHRGPCQHSKDRDRYREALVTIEGTSSWVENHRTIAEKALAPEKP